MIPSPDQSDHSTCYNHDLISLILTRITCDSLHGFFGNQLDEDMDLPLPITVTILIMVVTRGHLHAMAALKKI